MELSPDILAQVKNTILSKQFDGRYQEFLSQNLFPEEFITEEWKLAAMNALLFASPLTLGISVPEFETLVKALDASQINLLQFSILSNNLESRTANDLRMPLIQYLKSMLCAFNAQQKWKEITDPMRQQVVDELTDPSRIKAAVAGKFTERPAGMGAIKAEA